MRLCDAGPVIVKAILLDLEKGYRVLPTQVSFKHLEKDTGVRAQSIGMAFDHYIKPPLSLKGVQAEKRGPAGNMMIALTST